MTFVLRAFLALCLALTLAASQAQAQTVAPKAASPAPAAAAAVAKSNDDIIDTAKKAGTFKTLAQVLDAAGLTQTLKGKGPMTVFAPTDDAFAKLPKQQLDALLDPKNKRWLITTLGAHVLAGKALKSDRIKEAKDFRVKMSNGSWVEIVSKADVVFGNAKVTKADIETSNGVIHVIDAVYLPKRTRAALFAIDKAAKIGAAATAAGTKVQDAARKTMENVKDAAGKVTDKAKDIAKPAPVAVPEKK